MAIEMIKRARAIWASEEFRRKWLTPVDERHNRSKQVTHAWPPSFRVEHIVPTMSLDDELACWERASDEDFSSFESGLG